MICGLLPPTAREIIFQGADISPANARTYIGVCPQENVFWPRLTCYEQLIFAGRMYDFPAKALKTRANELITLMGLKEKSRVLANNVDQAERLADRVEIIDRGKLLLVDTPDNLKKTIGQGDILEIVLEKKNQRLL